jgi:hypothetical protein
VVGFDFVSLAPVYEVLHSKLVKSYAMDAFLQQKKSSANGSVEKARAFIGEAGQTKEERFKSMDGTTGSRDQRSWALLSCTRKR